MTTVTTPYIEPKTAQDQLSMVQLIALHLLPGMVITLIAAGLMWLLRDTTIPPIVPMSLAVLLGLIPTELGMLLYLGKQRNGRLSLDGIVHYQRPLPTMKWIGITLGMFILTAFVFTIAGAFDGIIFEQLFGWLPAWLNVEALDLSPLSTGLLWASIAIIYLFACIVGPYIEELYFRGYLLPRMHRFGRWAIPFNSFLFALYHFWTPWHLISRTIGSMTLGYSAKKFNLNVAIAVHILLNTIGMTLTLMSLLSA